MTVEMDRRWLGKALATLFAVGAVDSILPNAAEARGRREVSGPSDPASLWRRFQQTSEIAGVYSGEGGSYVVVKPKALADGRNHDWYAAAANHPSIHAFFENNSDDEGALFFLRNNQEPLIAQNIVGIGLWDNGDRAIRDLIDANEGREFLSVLRARNVLAQYEDGIFSYDDPESAIQFAGRGMTFSYHARDAKVSSPNGDLLTFVRNQELERTLKARFARGEAALQNLVPPGLATLEDVLVDRASGNAYVLTRGAETNSLRLHVVAPNGTQVTEYELTAANPARRHVSTGGDNYFYRTAEGHSFVLYRHSRQNGINEYGHPRYVNVIEGSLRMAGTQQRIVLENAPEGSSIRADILRGQLSFRGQRVLLGSSGYMANNPAVVDVPSSYDVPHAARPGRVRAPQGFQMHNRNNGG